jgi:hypothetical protein
MLRKFEYLAAALGHHKDRAQAAAMRALLIAAIDKAKEIDQALVDLYGDVNTYNWVSNNEQGFVPEPEDITFEDIYQMASNTEYCIACQYHSIDCGECLFAHNFGKCRDSDSLYYQFYRLLYKIREEKWGIGE